MDMTMESMTLAERAVVVQKAMHDDQMRRTAVGVMDLRKAWEAAKKVAVERKAAYDEALGELLLTAVSGPPKPDPQLRLPLEDSVQSIDVLAIQGEASDALKEAGIDTVEELDLIINGEHDDYASLEEIQGITPAFASAINLSYEEWLDKNAVYDGSDEGVLGEAPIAESAPMQPVERESSVDEIPAAERVRVLVTESIDDCPVAKGAHVDGQRLDGDMVRIVKDGVEFLLQPGEYDFVQSATAG
jgi:hypothetical protein